jgi:hypothetical protein
LIAACMEPVEEPAQDDGVETIGDRDRIPAPCARESIARRRLRDVITENKWVGHRLAAYRRFDHRYMDRQAYVTRTSACPEIRNDVDGAEGVATDHRGGR